METRLLGQTGLRVGRLGVASSYGAPVEAYEEAFERGCNYFTLGSFLRGRSRPMREAIRNLASAGKRDALVLASLSYAHNGPLMTWFFERELRLLGIDHMDVLLLGWHNRPLRKGLLAAARRLKERGLVRAIGVTSHNRKLLPRLAADGTVDLFHVRYNAAHRSAEDEVFGKLGPEPPGVVSFTATDWGKLLDPKRMPAAKQPLSAPDCYRFVLAQSAVDVCMTGPKTLEQMRENLRALELPPLSQDELSRIRRIGDYIYAG